jgi:hypothetical protein
LHSVLYLQALAVQVFQLAYAEASSSFFNVGAGRPFVAFVGWALEEEVIIASVTLLCTHPDKGALSNVNFIHAWLQPRACVMYSF